MAAPVEDDLESLNAALGVKAAANAENRGPPPDRHALRQPAIEGDIESRGGGSAAVPLADDHKRERYGIRPARYFLAG